MNVQGRDSRREAETDEVAILVHGTFAGDDEDAGEKWWQENSSVACEFERLLPARVRVAAGKEVFHWSGDNGERARSKAAVQLLEHLKPLEEAGKAYHLVGHSHGGSVIWNALRMSTLASKPLRGMKSWTTVGTPFLHHRSRNPWHFKNLIAVVLGLALLRPAFRGVSALVALLWDAVCGRQVAITLITDAEAGYSAVLRAPFLALAEKIGISVERTATGIRLGGFDPSGDLSLAQYLFTTSEGVILLCIVVLAIYVFLHLAIMCVRPVIESFRIFAESRLQRRAFSRYGPRWLGIWSPDDEAINGLRATLDLSMSFVRKMTPSDRVFLSDNLSLISRPLYWLFAPLFNLVCRPAINTFVRGLLIRSAQGNDRPTAQVFAVAPFPAPEADQAPPLPELLRQEILREADRNASAIAPKLRRLLGSPSFTSGLESFGAELSGREMVHTSYFDHEEILQLISYNIACPQGDTALVANQGQVTGSLLAWFAEFKETLKTGASPAASVQHDGVTPTTSNLPPLRRAG
jgi:hypothetical protein